MRRHLLPILLIAVILACTTSFASAQEEEKPQTFIYATYFECDVPTQDRADAIVKHAWAPAYDAAVEAGTILSWGWLAHHTGGKWRRVLYYSAPGLEALIDAPDAINPKIEEANPTAGRMFSEICGPHDDYIWESGTSSQGAGILPTERGKVGMSVYFNCQMSNEDRADEIVENDFAPIYNRHVSEGHLASWGWLKHYVGGKWRRATTFTATDIKSLFKARDAIFADMANEASGARDEFGEICGSHQDYVWNLLLETP